MKLYALNSCIASANRLMFKKKTTKNKFLVLNNPQTFKKTLPNMVKPSYLRIKFFFISNFKPIFLKSVFSRQYFCKNFFLFIYFLIFYLNQRLGVKREKLARISTNNLIKSTKLEYCNWFKNPFEGVNENREEQKVLYNLRKIYFEFFWNYFFFLKLVLKTQTTYPKFSYSLTRVQFKLLLTTKVFYKYFFFHFIIFTKFFSHFVVLRAPFRDKISKNLLSYQRFFIYLNLKISKINYFYFTNKFYFYQYLQKFFLFTKFSSNILFIHSQKIMFKFIFTKFTHIV